MKSNQQQEYNNDSLGTSLPKKGIRRRWLASLFVLWDITSFLILVIICSLRNFLTWGASKKGFLRYPFILLVSITNPFHEKASSFLNISHKQGLSRSYLIELSLRNMRLKKARTVITIGGMSIGIAFIVFLVSVGYGLQNLVTSRVARLEELQQAEVLPGLSDDLNLNDEVLVRLKEIPQVIEALPLISVVGQVSYNESVFDMAVYGVTTGYLKNSAVQPVRGQIFESEDLVISLDPTQPGEGVAETPLEDSLQDNETAPGSSVLSLTTEGGSGTLPMVELAPELATSVDEKQKVVEVYAGSVRQAVVNRATLTMLGLSENDAVGKSVDLTFIAVGVLLEGDVERIESVSTAYEIVGVTPDEGTPVIYVPFIDLRSLGISRFSQVKVVVENPSELSKVRSIIEASGYGTVSVVDTVAQIDSLFATFRLVLAVLGMVALSVAALGMFNTLTVSLLERTREVGLMKAMGMKSDEVKELFLTESMIMGFYGGLLGLLLGFLAGKILSIFLSAFAVVRGVGVVDVSSVPLAFILVVVALSIVVGIATGYFPAKRATKISALNALRYE
jgi:putative ABC transport system permease protein